MVIDFDDTTVEFCDFVITAHGSELSEGVAIIIDWTIVDWTDVVIGSQSAMDHLRR